METAVKKPQRHAIFNIKLYVDMLRQLKLIGLILGVITLIITVLPPLILLLNSLSSSGGISYTPSVSEVTPVLWGYMFVGGAGLVFTAFSFLGKRNSSDYYHSLPNTAASTWLSVTAAAVTWIFVTIAANVIIAYLTYLVIGVSISAIYLPYLLGYFLIGTLLVAAAACVAVCITGTKLTNFVLTCLILFVPRFITLMLAVSIVNRAVIIPFEQTGIVFNPLYNIAAIPMTLFINTVNGANLSAISFLPGFLYSALLALVFFGCALFLYRARRSETAGMSAPSRLLQHVYRCVITLPILIILPTAAFSERRNIFKYFFENISLSVVLLAISMIVYFTYELVTTKKFKNVLTTLPLFLLLIVAVPVVSYYGTSAASHAMLHNVPSKSSVTSINDTRQVGYDLPSYSSLLFAEIDHNDPELISIVITALGRTVNDIESGNYQYGGSFRVFKINYGISSITRRVYLTESEYVRVNELITGNADYIKAAKSSFPLDREISSLRIGDITDRAKLSRIWALYKDEIARLNPSDIEAALNGTFSDPNMRITVNGSRGLNVFSGAYPISSYTPKTAEAFFKLIAQENGEEYAALANGIVNNNMNFSYAFFSIEIYNAGDSYTGELYFTSASQKEWADRYDPETGSYKSFEIEAFSVIKLFFAHTQGNLPENTTLDSPFACVSFSYYKNDSYDWNNVIIYVPLTLSELEAFNADVQQLYQAAK